MVAFGAIFATTAVQFFQYGIIWGANLAQTMGTGASYMMLGSIVMEAGRLGLPVLGFLSKLMPATSWLCSLSMFEDAVIEPTIIDYPADPYWHWVAAALTPVVALARKALQSNN